MDGALKPVENIVHEWNSYDKHVNLQTIGNNQLYMNLCWVNASLAMGCGQ
jgi:hypothetical protein